MFRGNIEYINSLMRFSYKHIDERLEKHKNEYSKIKDRELDIIGNLKKKITRNIETFEEFEIKLSNNRFFGEIPSSYGNLKNLKILLLDNNELSEYVPYSFKNLQNLKTLSLNNNRELKGCILRDLKIEQCDYGGTQLCSLKSDTCNNNFERKCILADLQEINSSNGIPENDIKEYENEASSKSKNASPVTIFIYFLFFTAGIFVIVYILICCCCGYSNNKKGSSTNQNNAEILDKKPSKELYFVYSSLFYGDCRVSNKCNTINFVDVEIIRHRFSLRSERSDTYLVVSTNPEIITRNNGHGVIIDKWEKLVTIAFTTLI
ncbi:hypothetical protein H8356DRAFT_1342617 [Neocallimastix lanati (nom. inval.)]|nr:hypothetical protein H8356DRAFT_1342617 [Neocallimastix sp. JGI-2020a]